MDSVAKIISILVAHSIYCNSTVQDNWLNFFRNELNMTVLHNANALLGPSRDESVCIAGVDDFITRKLFIPGEHMFLENMIYLCKEKKRPLAVMFALMKFVYCRPFPGHSMDPARAIAGCPTGRPVVLLAHQPNAAKEVIARVPNKVDLVLSGEFRLLACEMPLLNG